MVIWAWEGLSDLRAEVRTASEVLGGISGWRKFLLDDEDARFSRGKTRFSSDVNLVFSNRGTSAV